MGNLFLILIDPTTIDRKRALPVSLINLEGRKSLIIPNIAGWRKLIGLFD